MTRHRVLFLLAATLIACGPSNTSKDDNTVIVVNNQNGQPNSQPNSVTPDLDCDQECADKEVECGLAGGDLSCDQACAVLTNPEVACLAQVSCEDLFAAQSVDDLCGGATNNSTFNNSTPNNSTPNNSTPNNSTPNNSSGGCSTPAMCDGDTLVTCELVSGIETTIRSACVGGCENGECLGAPSAVTVSGNAENGDPITVEDNGDLISQLSIVSRSPSYSMELPDGVRVTDESTTLTVQSPSLGSCTLDINPLLNRTEMSLQMLGQDTLPATDCFDFLTDVSNNGITVLIEDVPYLNIGGTVDITMEFN